MPTPYHRCAGAILEAVPQVMRFIRAQVRGQRLAGLSVPQFRLLAFLGRVDAATLSAVAEHLGLSLPSLSRTVKLLAARELLTRQTPAHDRRKTSIRLTPKGKESLTRARQVAQSRLAQQLLTLGPEELAIIERAMWLLRRSFEAEALTTAVL